jgi:uncharacterized protein (DUF1501 family)
MSSTAKRRSVLKALAGAPLVSLLPGLSIAAGQTTQPNRFVLVILRGALDGLAAVQPAGDPDLAQWRQSLLVPEAQLLSLDGFFGLHPALKSLHALYQASQLEVFHAVATPYRARSHFDAQNVLETGLLEPDPGADGWLNRLAGWVAAAEPAAMAIGQVMPKVLQGPFPAGSWTPDKLPPLQSSTLERLQRLYARDAFLDSRLQQALQIRTLVDAETMAAGNGQANFATLAAAAASFLRQDIGPAIAVLELGGWDTHANQGAAQGTLAQQLTQLDTGLDRLRRGLGARWKTTQVLVVTEFGRTVAVNGSGGTDHGTASVAFRLGGSVAGGTVRADWPGLKPEQLHEQRDLRPTLDMRRLYEDAALHLTGQALYLA